ncbi:MAG: uracil-DNA glycosylase family protein [Pseudomonadota bacterium]
MNNSFTALIRQVRACTLCAETLVHGVRPVLQMHPQARILIAGQAPGARVHATGIPFDDASGRRLRDWMGVSEQRFYDERQIAILPMGLCYPGKGASGDLPPLPICAQTWRERLLAQMPAIGLTLVIGRYAQAWHLPEASQTLTETVRQWDSQVDNLIPLPHPSPRNNIWLKRNPWFEARTIPALQRRIADLLG